MPRLKSKPKQRIQPPAANQSTDTSPEIERQFEVELCWCIQQLQTALRLGKLGPKQVQDHTKALNVLMSKSAPFVQKRQVMRLSFGDYRSKMAVEEKKLQKVNIQVKLAAGKPSAKSVFVKKSADSNFKFGFDVPKSDLEMDVGEEGSVSKSETGKDLVDESTDKFNNFNFSRSDNSFKFNFNL